jgi:hypothetical protein
MRSVDVDLMVLQRYNEVVPNARGLISGAGQPSIAVVDGEAEGLREVFVEFEFAMY